MMFFKGFSAPCHHVLFISPSDQRRRVLELWPDAMLAAGAGVRSLSSRERGISGRKLTRLLREFADVRS